MNPRAGLVAWLLFVSGLCALVFQTAWLREFRLIFGASTPASAAVLAIFMGGLGLGNALLGRRADAAQRPLRLYAAYEIGISLLCGASPFLVQLVRAAYIAIGGQETLGIYGATLVRLLLATLVIGLPTFLMGGTLPAAARAVTDPADKGRRDVGLLYGLNTLGAVCGVLLSTFFLLETLGTRATLWAACALNLVNALAAWKLAERLLPLPATQPVPAEAASAPAATALTAKRQQQSGKKKPTKQPAQAPAAGEAAADAAQLPGAPFYAVAALAGFVFFLMELVWYRMLGPILGGSTFTFGLILAVALAGIGIGGALYPAVYRGRRPDLRSLALTLAWEALAIALPFALGDRLAILALVLRSLAYYGFLGQALGWLVVAAIVIFPAALISGIQFPLLVALIGQGNRDVGKQLGQAFAWNTAGAMAGSLAGGFGLLALLSATGVWQLAAALLIAAALALLVLEWRGRRQLAGWLQPLAVAALAGVCLLALGPTAAWRHSGIGAGRAALAGGTQIDLRTFLNNSRRHVIWQADGRESSVAISAQNGVAFIVNGKSDGNAISDAGTQVMLGVLGALLHEAPRDGLVIGLGTGESAGWLASLPAIERVDVVELEPAIREVARACAPLNHNVLRHPKVHLTLNDAREVLQTTRRRYDVIASEPSNPYRTGVSSLYTREFYESARERLRPGGVFVQWLQGYEIDLATVRTVLATLHEVFPSIEIWETNPADLLLICSREPLAYTAADLSQRMAEPAMAKALVVGWRTTTVEGVLAHLLAGPRYAQAAASQPAAVINTDDQNSLEYRFARTVGRSAGFTNTGLRAEAVAAGLHRPPRLEAEVDWERVEDCRIGLYAMVGENPLPPEMFAGERAQRAESLAAMVLRNSSADAVRIWEQQSKPPYDLPETLALALAYADQGNDKASDLAAGLRDACPLDSKAIAAILAARQGQAGPAAAQLRQLLVAMREDATPNRRVIQQALIVASELAEKHPAHVRTLYGSLEQPLAVYYFEDRRLGLLFLFGKQLGGREFAQAAEQVEPYPPWDLPLLTARVEAYEQTNHPNLARARRELEELRRLSPEASVLGLGAPSAAPRKSPAADKPAKDS